LFLTNYLRLNTPLPKRGYFQEVFFAFNLYLNHQVTVRYATIFADANSNLCVICSLPTLKIVRFCQSDPISLGQLVKVWVTCTLLHSSCCIFYDVFGIIFFLFGNVMLSPLGIVVSLFILHRSRHWQLNCLISDSQLNTSH